jgi:hypothetical protein
VDGLSLLVFSFQDLSIDPSFKFICLESPKCTEKKNHSPEVTSLILKLEIYVLSLLFPYQSGLAAGLSVLLIFSKLTGFHGFISFFIFYFINFSPYIYCFIYYTLFWA